jgi:integrase
LAGVTRDKKALTDAGVRKFKAAKTGARDAHYDALTPGLALRVTDKGVKSWSVMYRVRGDKKVRRLTLGGFPVVSVAAAREQARDALLMAKKGVDPKVERDGISAAPPPDTFEGAINLFITEHIEKKLRPRSQAEYLRPIEQVLLPRWGARAVRDITRNDIRGIRDDIARQRGPVAANRALSVISKFFNFCLDENLVDASPSARIAPAAKEAPRDRTLSDEELTKIWAGADEMGYPYGDLFKLLILTGQRRSEVAGIGWSEISGDTWTIPRARMKGDKVHIVPLSSLSQKVIKDINPKTGSNYLLTKSGSHAITGFGPAKLVLDKLCGVTDWHLHDIRRTVVTAMRRDLKFNRDIVGAVVGHAAPGITAHVYDHYDQLDEKRGALDAWARKIGTMVGEGEDNVLLLRS